MPTSQPSQIGQYQQGKNKRSCLKKTRWRPGKTPKTDLWCTCAWAGTPPPTHTHTNRHTLGTGRANEEPVKTLMFTEEGTGIHCGLSSVTLQGHFGNRCYRQMRHHFLVQDVADFLQIQYFSTVHGTSFQPSSLNSAQSSSPSLLGSPLFQYFMKLNSRCEPSTQCHTPSCFRSDRPIQA